MDSKNIPIPKGKFVKKVDVFPDGIDIEFGEKQKVALLFISLNQNYWPYVKQVIQDCKTNFLNNHNVDYFVWSDMPQEELTGTTVFPTDPVGWPAPTLMRYHLFLAQEEKLKDYDYIFYLDADMRVVDKINEEILSEGLLAAEHPMYALRKEYVPPYEPNEKSSAYIKRPGRVIDENGKLRFKPYYIAGGFQGGKSENFIQAMKVMKENIDKDFDKNYTAIWNDESHWNKYVFDLYEGPLTVLGPEYIYPDSLIKEYYEPIWGKKINPKIITLTKPFSLSKEGGAHISEFLGKDNPTQTCPKCGDSFTQPGFKVLKIIGCPGTGKAHELEMERI